MEVRNIPVERICPSPMNPRKTFDESQLQELAQNIRKQGLLQPITVRVKEYRDCIDEETSEVITAPYKYEIICGERRYRACKILAEKRENYTIPCIIRDMDDKEAFDAMITENLQRKDVDPIEEAIAFSLLMKNGSTVEDIAVKFGKSFRFVQDRCKLNNLIPKLVEALREEIIPISGAMMLAKLDEDVQERFVDRFKNMTSIGKAEIKNFINIHFGVLDDKDFMEDEGFSDKFPLCKDCAFNTANHGCLFYEMKSDEAKCTHTKCMKEKMKAHVIWKILKNNDNLVKIGEPLEFGKTVVCVDRPSEFWDEDLKQQYKDIMAELNEKNILVLEGHDGFDGKCFYDEDDERLQKFIEEKKVYKCISFMRWSDIKYEEYYSYVKKSTSSENFAGGSVEDIEIDKLESKKKRNLEIQAEKTTEALVERFRGLPKYTDNNSYLTQTEQNVFDALIFSLCSYLFKDQRKGGITDKRDYKNDLDFVRKHPEQRMEIYRAFIQNQMTNSNYLSETMEEGLRRILLEWDNEETRKIIDDLSFSYKKRNDRLDEKINELRKK